MQEHVEPRTDRRSSGNRGVMFTVAAVLVALIGGLVLLLMTAPPSTEPDRVRPNEWVLDERSRSFLWGERIAEVKNPAEDVVFAYFINHRSPESSRQRAEDCARTELARFTTATCYAFVSDEAIEVAGIPSEGGPPGTGCWLASATATRASTGEITVESGDNPSLDPSCPV